MNLFAKSVRLPHLLAILLIGAAGCGLSDYHSRMDAQRERVKEFDDANRALDDPIEIPTLQREKPKNPPKDAAKDPKDDAKDPNAWLFDFYLRLPKGFGSMPKDKAPIYSTFPCFRYAGNEAGYDIFVAAAFVVDPKKEKDEFGKYSPESFRFWLRTAIKDYYMKTNYKLDMKLLSKEMSTGVKVLSPFSDVTAKIHYTYFEYPDPDNPKVKEKKEPSVFRVYFHEEPATVKDGNKEPGNQIAIIVHRPARPSDAFDKAMDACLGTLDTKESLSKRGQFKKLMKR